MQPRPTVGFLTPNVLRQNHPLQWFGAVDAARERGVNLVCFLGEALHSPRGFEAQANVLYDLVDAEVVNGLAIWSGQLEWAVDRAEMEAFCKHYHPLPVVSAETAFEGIPSVLVDNFHGMRAAIAHLIEVHGLGRIAYIRGPAHHWGAQERYRAYAETLAEYGLPLDTDLVAPPSEWLEGAAMIELLLDDRKLRPGVDFEALAAVNDDMAFDVLRVLQARGIRVPEDVAVVGFDDHMRSRAVTPPLTTVRPPFYETGHKLVETLLTMIGGEQVPDRVTLPAELVVRQSCGCLPLAVQQAAAGSLPAIDGKTAVAPSARREGILAQIVRDMEASEGVPTDWLEPLLDALFDDLVGEPSGAFLQKLGGILGQVAVADVDVNTLHRALSMLRRHTLPYLDDGTLAMAEDLWQQARVMIGEMVERAQAYKALQAEQQAQALQEIGESLITTFDVVELMDVLAKKLPGLGIPSAYLSLYERSPEGKPEPVEGGFQPYAYSGRVPDWSRLMLVCADEQCVDLPPDGLRFPSRRLVPEGLWPDRSYSYVVKPLYFRDHQIGFALFEVGPWEGRIYEALRGDVSSALYGGLLLRAREEAEAALERAYAEVERQVEERTAALEREIEGRERAQAESVRLQQEVIEAQKHAIQELSTPIIPVLEGVIVMPLIGSIDTLRAKDITRSLLVGIREHSARVVILDITGVPIVDSGVASYLNKTIQAARLKGARTIVTGVSEAVAETVVDLGIDWSQIETLRDLRTGLRVALTPVDEKRG